MEAWPLGAIDLFHLHTHQEIVRAGLGPNSCVVVAELDGRVSLGRVRARVEEAAAAVPELCWRMGRDRRLERVWRPGGARPEVRERHVAGDLLATVVGLLSEDIEGRAPWRFWVLHGRERDAVAVNWFHAATDARGAAQLLAWLGDEEAPPPQKRWMTGDRLLEKLSSAEQRELTQRYVEHAFQTGTRPILSLQRAARRGTAPGPQRALRVRLGAAETEAFDRSMRKRAGLADTSVLLWAAARLVDRMLRERGFSPVQQVVPVPLSLDPKKAPEPRLFGNHLTMMLLALDRDDLADEARAVAHLAAQRRDIVRSKLDVAMLAAIRASRHVPQRVADWVSRRPFGGERSSFVMSNPGAIEMGSLFGRPVIDAYAVPTLLPSPGFQVTVDRFGGRLSLMIMLREGYASLHEVSRLLPILERDLLG